MSAKNIAEPVRHSEGHMWGLKTSYQDPKDHHTIVRVRLASNPPAAPAVEVRAFRHLNLLKWAKRPRTDKPSSPDYPEHPLAKEVAPLYRGENLRHKENIAYRLKLHRKKPLKEREKIREEAFSDRYTPAPRGAKQRASISMIPILSTAPRPNTARAR